jgi:SAM-dependent MidA family methyltransferase
VPQPPHSLPEPDADARAHSARVVAAVRDAIDGAGGWIPYARYAEIVLYAPGLGYYVAGARKFGRGGDFVTAPELTSLYAEALAKQVAAILDKARSRDILELGAGSGRFAADLLTALRARKARPSRYSILELGAELRERQREAVAGARSERVAIEWIDALPDSIDGAVVLNEVLDAVPPHVVARRGNDWMEAGVAWRNDRLVWQERPLLDPRLLELADARFPDAGDYLSELNPAAEALIEDIGRRMRSGAILIVDYGFPRAEYYHPQRREGTIMGHYRHRSHSDPFLWPGLSDLTSHVDFTAIAEAGERAGLEVAGFTSQTAFLLGCDILDHLAAKAPPDSAAYLREAAAVNQLTSPAEMGELCKVLALARTPDIGWPGFSLRDQTHRL